MSINIASVADAPAVPQIGIRRARQGWIARARARPLATALLEALKEIDGLTSAGICVVGHKGKDRYIRLIGTAARAAIAAATGAES